MGRSIENLENAFEEMFDFITDLPSGLDGFESDFDSAFEELKGLKSTLTPRNKWVSVDEGLPEGHVQVLMWSAKWNIAEAGNYYNKHFWVYNEIGDAYIADNITYWMLLPTPPDCHPPERKDGT